MASSFAMKHTLPFWRSRLFWGVLVLKIAASFFFASSYMKDLFIPFINYFVASGFQNPWEFFYAQGLPKMFPYPPVMLWIMALPRLVLLPFFSGDWQTVTPLHLFAMRVPLLAADVVLLAQLTRFFPTQSKRTLLIYWCSPILFFINYVHGQLDIIPTALLFSVLYLFLREHYRFAMLLLAVAAATKSHVLVVVPFLAVFLYKYQLPWTRLVGYLTLFGLAYVGLLCPYAGSVAFREMVFNSPEQKKLFDFTLLISENLRLVVSPTVLTLLFIKFASYKKLNREILMMFLGIVFAVMVVLVPPMPGWFLWSLPFVIYFYLGNKEYSRAPFILFNVIYLIYFLVFFERESAFLNQLQTAVPVKDLMLSVVMASVAFIAFWMFGLGIRRNEELKVAEAPLLIGIGGDSGTGKHVLLRVLRNIVGKSRSIPVFGDNFHKWERGHENWQVYTHLNPSANALHQGMDVALSLKDNRSVTVGHYDHQTGKFTEPSLLEPKKFVFLVGLHPFYLRQMRDMMPIKIFLDTEEQLRQMWKIQRDVSHRGHTPHQILEQIASREDDKIKYIEPQKHFADLIIRYEATEDLAADQPIDGPVNIAVSYVLNNSINLDRLIGLLKEVRTLEVRHTITVDDQTLRVSGTITAREVMNAGYQLGLNFEELMVNTRGWLRNHNGVTQLVFLLVCNHQMRA